VDAIAEEKSGIMRDGTIVVTAGQPEKAMDVIQRHCRERNARLVRIDREWSFQPLQDCLESGKVGQTFLLGKSPASSGHGPLSAEFSEPQQLFIPLLGEHQISNATLAVAVADCFSAAQGGISVTDVKEGLASIVWPGRLEIVKRDPMVVVDGAHNPDSASKLMQALRTHFRYRKLLVVIGIVYSKDIRGILGEVMAGADELIAVDFTHRRATSTDDLVSSLQQLGYQGRVSCFPTVVDGLMFAINEASGNDLVCVTGSMYVVAQARNMLLPS
jgi:dihydrofolate synthase/folylpolyglutamate synthase